MKFILRVPPDASLLSSALYEGIAYLLKVTRGDAGPGWVSVPDDALVQAFSHVLKTEGSFDNIKKRIDLPLVGNDIRHKIFTPLLRELGVKSIVKITNYGTIIAEVAKIAEKNPSKLMRSGVIEIGMKLAKGKNKKVEVKVGPAFDKPFLKASLFKCDRYTSLGIAEFGLLGEEISQSVSGTVALLCLLGIYSSYVGRVNDVNFFLFLDPSEIAEVLSTSALRNLSVAEVIKGLLRIRDVGRNLISELLHTSLFPTTVLARIALSVELAKVINDTNIDILRMRLTRINVENMQTYKVYSGTIIEARREPLVVGELAKELAEHVSPRDSPLIECVRRFVIGKLSKRRQRVPLCEESDYVLKAVNALYRFVALKDPIALAEYARYLRDSINVLDTAIASGNASRNANWRRNVYRYWLSKLEYTLAELVRSK